MLELPAGASCRAVALRRRMANQVAEIVVSSHSELACAKFDAGSQSEHENISRRRARTRILRIRICKRPGQERSCTTDTVSNGRKDLLREDHRFWHSSAMRKVVRHDVSDDRQPATGYRARINSFAKKPQFGER